MTQVLSAALEQELSEELGELRARQEKHLRRELDRVDDYFENYSSELTRRAARSPSIKMTERLETAKQEHQRHRSDQIARHEITIKPQIDTLLLVAEPAWRTRLSITHAHDTQEQEAHFIPRSRRWERIS